MKTVYFLFGAGIFILAFLGAFSSVIPTPDVSVEWDRPDEGDRYVPTYKIETRRELAFVYIGSSGCAASNRPFLPEAIEELKLLVQEYARTNGRSFVAIGMAKDWSVERGLEHLDKFGRFDEVMTGRNWLNVGALKYLWVEIPGKAATPQVLIVDRFVETPIDGERYSIRDEVLLARKVGTREIRLWLEHGAPLPTLETPTEAEQ